MSERVTARGVVSGRVQGVWYRAFTREQAQAHDLAGSARNLPDGSVAFSLTGPRDAIEAVLDAMREGPPLARVDYVDVSWHPADDASGFHTA